MDRKTLLVLALASVFVLPTTAARAEDDKKPEAPQLIAEDDKKPEAPQLA